MNALDLMINMLQRLRSPESSVLVRIVHRGKDGEVLRVQEAPINFVGNFESKDIRLCIDPNNIQDVEHP